MTIEITNTGLERPALQLSSEEVAYLQRRRGGELPQQILGQLASAQPSSPIGRLEAQAFGR